MDPAGDQRFIVALNIDVELLDASDFSPVHLEFLVLQELSSADPLHVGEFGPGEFVLEMMCQKILIHIDVRLQVAPRF